MLAGLSRLDITPAVGVPLGGNVRADAAARGVHDPLVGVVLLLCDDSTQVAVVGTDLVAVPAWVAEPIAEAVAQGAGLRADQVVVHATHTHSGPDTTAGLGFADVPVGPVQDWLAQVLPRFRASGAQARASLVPATVRVGRADVPGVLHNRRVRQHDGSVRMNWEADAGVGADGSLGPVDPELTVLGLFDAHGGPLGAVVHYALHPAILVGLDHLVSADYVAAARDALAGPLRGAPVLYLSGALGDVNHLDHLRPGRAGGFDLAAQIGAVIGAGACAALAGAREQATPLRHRTAVVVLDQRTVDRERLAAARREVARHRDEVPDEVDGIPPLAYARWTLGPARSLTPLRDVQVQLVVIGPVVLVGLPFEVFCELGLQLRDAVPGRVVKVVGLVGDYLGYLPTSDAFDRGGYEPTFGTSLIAQGQAEYLVDQIRHVLTEVVGEDA